MSHWDKQKKSQASYSSSGKKSPTGAPSSSSSTYSAPMENPEASSSSASAKNNFDTSSTSNKSTADPSSNYKSHTQAPPKQPHFHRVSDMGAFSDKKKGLYSKNFTVTDPVNWSKNIRAQIPTLLQVGKPTPKAVLSFGGCGMLCTYSLGVGQYLLAEKKDLVRQCYVVGTGSGTIPALALCSEDPAATPEMIKDYLVENVFDVHHEDTRLKVIGEGCRKFIPEDIHERMKGRCTLAVGMSNRDLYYSRQPINQQMFGAMISSFDSKEDVADCVIAATAPNATMPCVFRGEKCTRGTWKCLSVELDQYVRHIYIHGLSGYPHSSHHTRHNHYIGRHGFLCNSHWNWKRQFLVAIWPKRIPMLATSNIEVLKEAFEKGFNDARRYERWEEDVYLNAKPDRSVNDSLDMKNIRAAIFGSSERDAEAAKL